VAAAVAEAEAEAEASLIAHERLAGPELVPVRAAPRWAGDPRAGRGLYQLAQHTEALRRWCDNLAQQPSS
jgi:hypothetical protein